MVFGSGLRSGEVVSRQFSQAQAVAATVTLADLVHFVVAGDPHGLNVAGADTLAGF